MSIGTSLGAFYEDEFHQAAAEWDPKFDGNVDPSSRPDGTANDANVVDSTVKTQDFQTKVGWVDDLFGSLQAAPIPPKVVPDIHSLLDSQQFPEDGIGRLLGKEGPRWDRFREDEPGPMESAKQDKKVPVEPEDKMERKPSDVLGIDPTNDNNTLPYDVLYKRPGGLIHRVADKEGPFTPLSDEDHKTLTWDTPFISSKDPAWHTDDKEDHIKSLNEILDRTDEDMKNQFDSYKKAGLKPIPDNPLPAGRIRARDYLPAVKNYLDNLPEDVIAHDMKDGTVIFRKNPSHSKVPMS